MPDISTLFPRRPAPPLTLAGGGSFDLAAEAPRAVHAAGVPTRAALPDLEEARRWGLFVFAGRTLIGIEEPALFSEPGLFLVRADGALYFSSIQTMPFARTHFADVLAVIDTVVAKDYPARGEVERLPQPASAA